MPEPVTVPVVGVWKGWAQPFGHLTSLHAMRNGGSILLERIVSIVPLLSAKFQASPHYGKKSVRIAVAPSL